MKKNNEVQIFGVNRYLQEEMPPSIKDEGKWGEPA
jgi:hypothetical protein